MSLFVFLVLLAALAVGWILWPGVPLLVITGVFRVATVVAMRLGWLRIFGPVIFYDMVRTARRGRYLWLRTAYAGLLFMILLMIAASMRQQGGWFGQDDDQARQAARL